jgi:hypothetical protein
LLSHRCRTRWRQFKLLGDLVGRTDMAKELSRLPLCPQRSRSI